MNELTISVLGTINNVFRQRIKTNKQEYSQVKYAVCFDITNI